MQIDYERIKPPKKGRPYNYKCRCCGEPATWKETLMSRDRRRCRVPWCICDKCYQAATGEHTGNQYTMARGNNFPLPKTAEKIGEQFNVPDRPGDEERAGRTYRERQRRKTKRKQFPL